MDEGNRKSRSAGCYLTPGERNRVRYRRVLMITMLLIWDGVLLYMIVKCLIEAVYGAAFVAAISIYLGYQL